MSLLLCNAVPWGAAAPADVTVESGRITGIGGPAPAGAELVDLSGCVLLPGFVDAHCHLDKTLWGGPWVPNPAGSRLADKIAYTRAGRAEHGVPSVDRIAALLERMAAAGTTRVRTHTDVSPEFGLDGVHAVRAAAERLADRITVQQVIFPQYGLLTNTGTAELMEQALRIGAAQVVGGIDPAGVDRDPVRHLDVVFGLATTWDVPIDLHLHDRDTLGAWEFELIIERTLATGMQHRVTIGHGFALGDVAADRQGELIVGLAEAGIALATCAAHNDPLLPLDRLRAAGVTVAAGSDGIRDLWSPYGDGDMLRRAHRLAERMSYCADFEIESALTAATFGGAQALRLEDYGLRPGARADLVAVPARTVAEAVVSCPPRRMVLRAGQFQPDIATAPGSDAVPGAAAP
ncbi:amidohydrolase [Nocardia sp. alder85J]|uniref:amidohydrolase n=1 Tax=Nocardia sp. alder85J TaxID=2862949 RepID=UPI001CD6022F|nr:amidohydrolase [Nocardia sp. alder85J]MCX4094093.1 amidohydrolase [Nocardia sp. alder85J]